MTKAKKTTKAVAAPVVPEPKKTKAPIFAIILLIIAGLLIIGTAAYTLIYSAQSASTAYSLLPSLKTYNVTYATIYYAIIATGVIGLVSGAILVLSGMMINKEHDDIRKIRNWSIVAIVFSIISIFGGGGPYFLGLILGIIGGVIGITYKP